MANTAFVGAVAGSIAIVIAEIVKAWVSRRSAKDPGVIELRTSMSDQTKVLFEQLATTVKEQAATIKEVTADRNLLQMTVFKQAPKVERYDQFVTELSGLGFTLEECLLVIHDMKDVPEGTGRRATDRLRRSTKKAKAPATQLPDSTDESPPSVTQQ